MAFFMPLYTSLGRHPLLRRPADTNPHILQNHPHTIPLPAIAALDSDG